MFTDDETQTGREFTPLYSWWASVLILEMLSFTWFTGRLRVRHEIIHSEEDRRWLKNPNVKLHPSGGGHPEVDRIREGHYKDLSLIIPYLLITPIWLNAYPSHLQAHTLLRVFPIAKIFDTLLFMKIIKAPDICRYLTTIISYGIVVYICLIILL